MKPLPSQIEALDPDFRDVIVEDDTDIHQRAVMVGGAQEAMAEY